MTIVLIHGYPLNQRIWRHQASEQFNILTPDLPGFGSTPPRSDLSMGDYVQFIIEFLDKQKIDKAVIAGHSMGGYIALEFAHRYAGRLLGLGLINTQAGADSDESRANRYKTIERVHKEGSGFIVEGMKEKLLAPDQLNPGLVSEIGSIMREASLPGITAALQAMARRVNHETTLKECSVPVLIITGQKDQLIPSERSQVMAELAKKCTFREIDGAGHLAMMEAPEEFNSTLTTFLTGLS